MRPCCLTIAGSDSGGNAGVQADLRVFHAYRVHGCTAIAALTAQNPFGVSAIHAAPPEFVGAQLDAVLGVYSIRALKTGMLASPGAIDEVAARLEKHPEILKVIDPVMVATSGARLVSREAAEALRTRLVPLATIVTPNIPEACELCGASADTPAGELARRLYETFGTAVLVKGGHGEGGDSVDTLCFGEEAGGRGTEIVEYSSPRIANPVSTHGTGCSLAAALAAELALGRTLREAVGGAKRYVWRAIESSYLTGPDGCGVLGWAESEN